MENEVIQFTFDMVANPPRPKVPSPCAPSTSLITLVASCVASLAQGIVNRRESRFLEFALLASEDLRKRTPFLSPRDCINNQTLPPEKHDCRCRAACLWLSVSGGVRWGDANLNSTMRTPKLSHCSVVCMEATQIHASACHFCTGSLLYHRYHLFTTLY